MDPAANKTASARESSLSQQPAIAPIQPETNELESSSPSWQNALTRSSSS